MAHGKVRALHPDFFSDDDLAEVSIPARLLFAGLWCFACDNGHLRNRSKQIKRWVYATDDVNVAALLRELEEYDLIETDELWITVPNLGKRQRLDWRYFKTCDRDDCERPDRPNAGNPERETPRAPDGSTRGARRERLPQAPEPVADGDGDGDGDGDLTPSRKRDDGPPPRFDEFWDTYGYKVGRKKAISAYRAALRKPDVTPDLLIATAGEYVAYVKAEGKHPTYTKHPATWLNGEHWRDERTARLTRVQQHVALAHQLATEQTVIGELA